MKRILFLPLFFLFSCSDDSSQKAGEYNDKVVDLANACVSRQEALLKAINARDEKGSEKALGDFETSTRVGMQEIRQLQPPGETAEDSAFKKAALDYFSQLFTLATNEYVEYRKLFMMPDSTFTELNALRHDSLADVINAKDSTADAAFIQAQARFVRRYKVRIE